MYKYVLFVAVALAAATMLALMAATLEPPQVGGLAVPLQTGHTAPTVSNPTPWV